MAKWLYVPAVLFLVWLIRNSVVYFTMNADGAWTDFANALITPYGTPNEIANHLRSITVDQWYGARAFSMTVHIGVTTVWGLSSVLQFAPFIPKSTFHRWNGRLYLLLTIVMMWNGYDLIANQQISRNLYLAEGISLFLTGSFAIKGWVHIGKKEVQQHKSSMIISTAGLYYFFVMRLIMPAVLLFSPAPFRSLSYYLDVTWGGSIWTAFVITYGIAVYYAFGRRPTADAPKKNL